MVADINSGSSLYGVLRYNKIKIEEGKGEVILCNKMLFAEKIMQDGDLSLCMRSFEPYLTAVKRAKETIFHASINPHPEDKLSRQQLTDIAQEYMERMGYGDQPYIVYEHRDIDRTHLHIVACRIRLDGSKIDYKKEVTRKSNPIIRDLEKKYGLIPALESRQQKAA